jgi:hypothetical protein
VPGARIDPYMETLLAFLGVAVLVALGLRLATEQHRA